jgi:hypothetical protein
MNIINETCTTVHYSLHTFLCVYFFMLCRIKLVQQSELTYGIPTSNMEIIFEASCSNLGCVVDYPDCGLRDFSSVSLKMCNNHLLCNIYLSYGHLLFSFDSILFQVLQLRQRYNI